MKATIMTPEEAKTRAEQIIPAAQGPDSFWADLPRQILAALLTAAPEVELPAILADPERLDQILAGHPHLMEALAAPEVRASVLVVISGWAVSPVPATEPTSTSPVVDVVAALDVASDRLALLGLTVTGMLSLGTAFAPDEARGALALLESIQDDLDEAKDTLRQGLDTRQAKIPAAA